MREKARKNVDLPALLAMVLFRFANGWDQAELAKASKTAPSQISAYHLRRQSIPRVVLERIAEAADFPGHLLDPLLHELRSFVVLAACGRSRVDQVVSTAAVTELMAVAAEALDVILTPLENRRP